MTSDITPTSPGGAGELRRAVEQYLATRRALGFALSTQGRLLMDFVGYCERHGAATVTTQVPSPGRWPPCAAGIRCGGRGG
jgi:hypothetical protein